MGAPRSDGIAAAVDTAAARPTRASVQAALRVLVEAAQEADVPPERVAAWRAKLDDPRLVISVVALMKAGKSTLLNSLLHQEFLPSAAQAATACVTRIIHDDNAPHGRLESGGKVLGEGRAGVSAALRAFNASRRDQGQKAPRLDLYVRVPLFMDGRAGARQVVLVDTPGPNEAGAGLEDEVTAILQDTDAILYVLDFTKLGTEDERKMLMMLKKSVKPLLDSAMDEVARVHFVLNKVDAHSVRNDPPLEQMLAAAAEKIRAFAAIEVGAGQLWPVAANLGLMARQVLCEYGEEPDQLFLEDFLRRAVGECFEDIIAPGEYLAKARQLAKTMAEKSRLAALEGLLARVADAKDAIVAKSILGSLQAELRVAQNRLATRATVLRNDAVGNAKAVAAMRAARSDILKRRATLDAEAAGALQETTAEAAKLFADFARDVEQTIAVLMTPGADSASSTVKMFMKLYTTIFKAIGELLRADAGVVLSKADAEEKAKKVNEGISELLSAKWQDYNTQLYHTMFLKHKQLDRKVDNAARVLLQELNDKKSAALETRMSFDDQVLTAPISSAEFRSRAESAMVSMVNEKRQSRVVEEEKSGKVKRVMCGMEKEEEITYSVFTTRTESTYVLNPAVIRDHWLAEIRTRVANSKQSTDLLIQRMVTDEINRIWSEVAQRADAAVASIEAEVSQKAAVMEDGQAQLAAMDAALSSIEEFDRHVDRLTAAVDEIR